MVNASNLNITHIGGKPVLIAGKPGSNVLTGTGGQASGGSTTMAGGPTTTSLMIGGQTVKVQGNLNLGNANQSQHVMIGNQLVKIQSGGQMTGATILKTSTGNVAIGSKSGNVHAAGTTFKMQQGTSLLSNQQQVVITSSGQAIKV